MYQNKDLINYKYFPILSMSKFQSKNKFQTLLLLLMLSSLTFCLDIGTKIPNSLLSLPIEMDGTILNTKLVLDSSWHWLHGSANSTKSCTTSTGWNKQLCNDPVSCWKACAIQGISAEQWSKSYGIVVNGDALSIGYVTANNVGSRMYLVQPNGQKYQGINMLARQLSFVADMSQAGCGLNGALYFVQMPLDGGPNLSSGAPSSMGLGYCDAQCPSVKFIQGKAVGVQGYYPTGACCAQFDVWQANNQATQMATHVCKNPGLFQCNDDSNCGRNGHRAECQCDMNGVSFNPYRNGNKTLFGTGSNFAIDTRRPFTVKTQFITDNGQESGRLIEIKRYYVQDQKTVDGGSIKDQATLFSQQLKGIKDMGEAFRRKMVLVFSLWDDYSQAHMRWLDGVYPPGSTQPWAQNGPCPADSGNPDIMRKQVPNSKVIYSKIKIAKLSNLNNQKTQEVLIYQ